MWPESNLSYTKEYEYVLDFSTVLQTASYDSLMGYKINCVLQLAFFFFFFKDGIEPIRAHGTWKGKQMKLQEPLMDVHEDKGRDGANHPTSSLIACSSLHCLSKICVQHFK